MTHRQSELKKISSWATVGPAKYKHQTQSCIEYIQVSSYKLLCKGPGCWLLFQIAMQNIYAMAIYRIGIEA